MPTVGSHQQGAFSTPANGQSGDATVVLANDNANRTTTNAHDADATIHVQSSVLASRPAAGTAGRVWVTSDGLRAYMDSGSVWNELAYLSLAAGGTVAGAVTVSASLTVSGTTNLNNDIAVNTNKVTIAAATGNTGIAGTLGVVGLVTLSAGLTVSSGTTAVQALTAVSLDTSGSVTVANGQSFSAKRNTGGAAVRVFGYDTGTDDLSTVMGGTIWRVRDTGAGVPMSLTTAGAMTLASSLTVSSGGINVTGGITGTLTTAAQPNITSVGTLSSLAVSGTATVGMATTSAGSGSYGAGAGTTIGSVGAGEVYLVIARSQSTNHYAYALAVGSVVIGSVVVTSLGSSGLTIGSSGVSITLTNGTAGTLTLDHSLLKLR